MLKRIVSFVAVAMLAAGPAAAQDPMAALQAAMDTMGVTDMTSIRYTGSGWVGAVGQNASPAEDWPRFELAEYERTIDFETNSSTENMVIRQGGYPARGGGGAPIQGDRIRNPRVRGEYAWDAPGVDRVVPQPQQAERRLLEIFLTPHGFLQGAAAGEPIAIQRNEYGQRVTVVSYIALGKYRINGTITEDNVVERVQTWMPSPVVGDMYYETVYTDYRDVGGGMMFPFNWHQHQDYDDGANEPNVSGGDHSFSLTTIDSVEVNVDGAALTVPDIVRTATVPPMRVESEEVADGVWLIAGGSHHSVAVEFADHVAVIEAPLNEARSLAVIDGGDAPHAGQADPVHRDHAPPLGPHRRPPRLRARGGDGRHPLREPPLLPGGAAGGAVGARARPALAASPRGVVRGLHLRDAAREVHPRRLDAARRAAPRPGPRPRRGDADRLSPGGQDTRRGRPLHAAGPGPAAARRAERQRPGPPPERRSAWGSTSRPSSPSTGARARGPSSRRS